MTELDKSTRMVRTAGAMGFGARAAELAKNLFSPLKHVFKKEETKPESVTPLVELSPEDIKLTDPGDDPVPIVLGVSPRKSSASEDPVELSKDERKFAVLAALNPDKTETEVRVLMKSPVRPSAKLPRSDKFDSIEAMAEVIVEDVRRRQMVDFAKGWMAKHPGRPVQEVQRLMEAEELRSKSEKIRKQRLVIVKAMLALHPDKTPEEIGRMIAANQIKLDKKLESDRAEKRGPKGIVALEVMDTSETTATKQKYLSLSESEGPDDEMDEKTGCSTSFLRGLKNS